MSTDVNETKYAFKVVECIYLTVYGKPATKKNSLRIVRVRGKNSKTRTIPIQGKVYQQWRKLAIPQLKAGWAGHPPIATPIQVSAVFYRDRRPDLVNLLQAIGDLLQEAGIVKNDRLIVSWGHSRIITDKLEQLRVEIEIRDASGPSALCAIGAI